MLTGYQRHGLTAFHGWTLGLPVLVHSFDEHLPLAEPPAHAHREASSEPPLEESTGSVCRVGKEVWRCLPQTVGFHVGACQGVHLQPLQAGLGAAGGAANPADALT